MKKAHHYLVSRNEMKAYEQTHHHFILPLATLNPDLSLALGVNEQWVACCLGDDDTVLRGQLVIGKTFQVPLSYLF